MVGHGVIGRWGLLAGVVGSVLVRPVPAKSADGREAPRRVVVELFTSQGCDMCPAAEKILGELAAAERSVVPVAFHVDYFNRPWRDVFSDPIYSQRQMAYHRTYTKPRPADYGLYYTPMVMVDGEESVNGRDRAAIADAVRRARAKSPAVAIDATLALANEGRSAATTISVTGRSPKSRGVPLTLIAVLREDGVVTDVPAGENAGKSLVARYPVRQNRHDAIKLDGTTPATRRFTFDADPSWNPAQLHLAVYVQDDATGAIHQAVDLPWRATEAAATPTIAAPAPTRRVEER